MATMRPADGADGAGAADDTERRQTRIATIEQARRELDDAEAVADHLAGDANLANERAEHAQRLAEAAEREARRLRWEADVLLGDARQIRLRAGEARGEVGTILATLRSLERDHRE